MGGAEYVPSRPVTDIPARSASAGAAQRARAARALRRAVRLPGAIVLLLGGLAWQVAVFPWASPALRERSIGAWSRMLLAVCGVRPGIDPPGSLPPGVLLVANHRSWLDIFVIHAVAPAQFVAKAEIRGWPVVGWLVALSGTHFIERGRRHAVHDVLRRIERALREGRRVGVFPAGTTDDGREMPRWHANLLQAAVDAPAPVVPLALRYLDAAGRDTDAVLYVGDITFGRSFWRVLGEPGLRATVTRLPVVDAPPGATRHAITRSAEAAVRRALGMPVDTDA